jgi:mannosyltransferase OCH1-like enzyme
VIPKKIHQIWLSDQKTSPIPNKYIECTKSWSKFNPEFEYTLWGEEVFEELGGRELLYEKYQLEGVHPAQISDILRILLIQKLGGFYADIDTECFQCIEPLFKNDFICYNYGYDSQKIIISFESWGAIPNHRFVNKLMSDIESKIKDPYIDKLWKYGFRRFQDSVILESDYDMTIYGPKTIKPYLKHHFLGSWL